MKLENKAWLAGLIDGEGTITVFKHKESTGWKLCPTVCVVNTDPNIINKVQSLAEEMGISLHLFTRQPQKKEHAISYQLNTRNTGYMKILLKEILPHLVGKKAQAEILLRFINSRKERTSDGGRALSYTDEEWKICNKMYVLNKNGVSRALND